MPIETPPSPPQVLSVHTSSTNRPRAHEGQLRSRLDAIVVSLCQGRRMAVFIAMAISVVEVVSRYVFRLATSWVHELVIL